MVSFKITGILIVLCSVAAACFSQVLQGGTHVSQVYAHVPQGSAHESQGGVHESQVGEQESQGGLHISQGGSNESQRRVRRQSPQAPVDWVTCDFTTPTKISCGDCKTRVICKPIGGILKPCSPKKPFCNNGVCSAVPSAECA